jgi:uncharacterized glyoxalase superfamily protein PhnB
MLVNRSMPPGIIIPELAYPDVAVAADWLCRAFGFRERLRIGDHRAQLVFEGAWIVVTRGDGAQKTAHHAHAMMVQVRDVSRHYARAVACGANASEPPVDQPYGERQYTVVDIGGHRWIFSQSIADVDPADWGGNLLSLSQV